MSQFVGPTSTMIGTTDSIKVDNDSTRSTLATITIRPAVIADARSIAEIHHAGCRVAYANILSQTKLDSLLPELRVSYWQEKIPDPQTIVLVAVDDNGVAQGFAFAGDVVRRDDEIVSGSVDGFDCEIYSLHCRPEMHRRGIGRRLTIATARAFVERDRTALMLRAYRDNVFRRFYDQIGGQIVAESIHSGVKDVVYGWQLGEATCKQQ